MHDAFQRHVPTATRDLNIIPTRLLRAAQLRSAACLAAWRSCPGSCVLALARPRRSYPRTERQSHSTPLTLATPSEQRNGVVWWSRKSLPRNRVVLRPPPTLSQDANGEA